MEAGVPQAVQQMDGQPVAPPLRYQIEFARNVQTILETRPYLRQQAVLSAFQSQQAHG